MLLDSVPSNGSYQHNSVNIVERILAGKCPDAPAIFYGNSVVSYGQLHQAVCSFGKKLLDSKVLISENIGILAENGPFYASAYLGVMLAGCCAVPLRTELDENVFASIVAQCNMKRLFVSSRFLPRIAPWAARLGLEILKEADCDNHLQTAVWPEIDPTSTPAAIMFTSGSTGEPKGVVISHKNIESNTQDIIGYMGLSPTDRVMVVLPFSYCYGASLLHTHLMAGASLVINNRFMFPEKVLDEMVEKQCTGMAGVPATYQMLLRKTRFASRQFPSLRWLQQAGGKLPNPLIREIRQAMPQVRLFIMYGQTEATARLSFLPPEMLDEKLGSIGRGLPHTQLEVLRPDGQPVSPGTDEIGEIVASGDNVTLGYYRAPEETARYFRNGTLYTGDMARVDAEGYIYIVERARDFIKAAGHRISPKEIEEVLAELPEIVEAAVIGVPDDLQGEAIKAFVVPVAPDSMDTHGMREHCLRRLPNYKIPQSIEILPRLPKKDSGKVDREALRALAAKSV